MNKYSSIFGQVLQGSYGDRSREEGQGVYMLATICSNAVLPVRAGPFLTGDKRRTGHLSGEA